jgi:hypothetical protein
MLFGHALIFPQPVQAQGKAVSYRRQQEVQLGNYQPAAGVYRESGLIPLITDN